MSQKYSAQPGHKRLRQWSLVKEIIKHCSDKSMQIRSGCKYFNPSYGKHPPQNLQMCALFVDVLDFLFQKYQLN